MNVQSKAKRRRWQVRWSQSLAALLSIIMLLSSQPFLPATVTPALAQTNVMTLRGGADDIVVAHEKLVQVDDSHGNGEALDEKLGKRRLFHDVPRERFGLVRAAGGEVISEHGTR